MLHFLSTNFENIEFLRSFDSCCISFQNQYNEIITRTRGCVRNHPQQFVHILELGAPNRVYCRVEEVYGRCLIGWQRGNDNDKQNLFGNFMSTTVDRFLWAPDNDDDDNNDNERQRQQQAPTSTTHIQIEAYREDDRYKIRRDETKPSAVCCTWSLSVPLSSVPNQVAYIGEIGMTQSPELYIKLN
jgi:hypothetical protein